MTIDEIIEDEAQHVNSTDLRVLESFSGRLLDKLKESNSDMYPGLREAVQVIILVLESPSAQQAKDPLPRWLADHLPKIGLADDALILQHVVERNQGGLHRSLAKCINVAAGNSRYNRDNYTRPRDHPIARP